jgi:predicted nucleic acid-binding protein
MSDALDIYVLDTSAWLTLIEDEAGAERIEELLDKAKAGEIVVLVSFMSFMEVYYITLQERDQNEAQARVALIAALPGLRVDSTEALGVLAGELKAKHRMSVADAWIAALAHERNATLVHKEPEFEQVEATIKVLKLPYKVAS